MLIYFITDGDAVKVGLAKSAKGARARLKNLQEANSTRLRIIAEFRGDVTLEKDLCRRLAPEWIRGEWFKDGDMLRQAMAEH